MKKLFLIIYILAFCIPPSLACHNFSSSNDTKAVEKLLKSQVKYANKMNFDRFIKTYASDYKNSDGFNLDMYSNLVKDIWKTYDNIQYDIEIKNIILSGNKAKVEVLETSQAQLSMSKKYSGELKSTSSTTYDLIKNDGSWKIISDTVHDETTTMLYGDAKGLDIKLSVPNQVNANEEYSAVLEFIPPSNTIAVASIASDIVEYPQKPTEEVFRTMPEDNILERLLISNNKNANEYVIASIGLTKTLIDDTSIKLNLTGFGYTIKRVNVLTNNIGDNNVKTK